MSTRTAALFQLAVDLPAAVLARCLGIDISSAVAWQRAAAGSCTRTPPAQRTAHQSCPTNDTPTEASAFKPHNTLHRPERVLVFADIP